MKEGIRHKLGTRATRGHLHHLLLSAPALSNKRPSCLWDSRKNILTTSPNKPSTSSQKLSNAYVLGWVFSPWHQSLIILLQLRVITSCSFFCGVQPYTTHNVEVFHVHRISAFYQRQRVSLLLVSYWFLQEIRPCVPCLGAPSPTSATCSVLGHKCNILAIRAWFSICKMPSILSYVPPRTGLPFQTKIE